MLGQEGHKGASDWSSELLVAEIMIACLCLTYFQGKMLAPGKDAVIS